LQNYQKRNVSLVENIKTKKQKPPILVNLIVVDICHWKNQWHQHQRLPEVRSNWLLLLFISGSEAKRFLYSYIHIDDDATDPLLALDKNSIIEDNESLPSSS